MPETDKEKAEFRSKKSELRIVDEYDSRNLLISLNICALSL
ncbi:MAG: hypothetical protein R3B66_16610 [Candidatus Scalinduaceae bacterium]